MPASGLLPLTRPHFSVNNAVRLLIHSAISVNQSEASESVLGNASQTHPEVFATNLRHLLVIPH